MISQSEKLFLVGDNPFHNISHLSQERARDRTVDPSDPKYAATLILSAMNNGANGFTFSVSENTLEILKELEMQGGLGTLHLLPVVPYAFEYVRLATQLGGIPGLAKKFGVDMMKTGNVKAIGFGLKGVVTTDPKAIMKTYLSYEITRIKTAVNSKINLDSIMLHQLVTDMGLALNMDWLFKSYIEFLLDRKITPGFNTGNFSVLVNKFHEWNIDIGKVLILTPFNKAGFQVTPSIAECEKSLSLLPTPNVIAMSVLASGYIEPKEALEYIAALPNIKGVAIGISKEKHTNIFNLSNQLLKK
ncbi:MAG: hypothetical protein ACFCUE_00910 [Candidatus Bathyarchaeia archaeon]